MSPQSSADMNTRAVRNWPLLPKPQISRALGVPDGVAKEHHKQRRIRGTSR
jgi:hypothetical protein